MAGGVGTRTHLICQTLTGATISTSQAVTALLVVTCSRDFDIIIGAPLAPRRWGDRCLRCRRYGCRWIHRWRPFVGLIAVGKIGDAVVGGAASVPTRTPFTVQTMPASIVDTLQAGHCIVPQERLGLGCVAREGSTRRKTVICYRSSRPLTLKT